VAGMTVRTNTSALDIHRRISKVNQNEQIASARLSTGKRINSAADDAAGLGISEKMQAQIKGLDRASLNAQDGISLVQTAEGAMATINEMLIRLRELLVQAANDTNVHMDGHEVQSDRARIQDEIEQIMLEINKVANRTEFNTRTLLDGSLSVDGIIRGGDWHSIDEVRINAPARISTLDQFLFMYDREPFVGDFAGLLNAIGADLQGLSAAEWIAMQAGDWGGLEHAINAAMGVEFDGDGVPVPGSGRWGQLKEQSDLRFANAEDLLSSFVKGLQSPNIAHSSWNNFVANADPQLSASTFSRMMSHTGGETLYQALIRAGFRGLDENSSFNDVRNIFYTLGGGWGRGILANEIAGALLFVESSRSTSWLKNRIELTEDLMSASAATTPFAVIPADNSPVSSGDLVNTPGLPNVPTPIQSSLLDLGNNFPREGSFVIQVRDPDVGTVNAILDFAVENEDGDFDLDDFIAFFRRELYDVIDVDETFIDADGHIVIHTTGEGGPDSWIRIGTTSVSAAHINRPPNANINPARFVNSAFFGVQTNTLTGTNASAHSTGFNLADWASLALGTVVVPLTPENYATQRTINDAALAALQSTNLAECPHFFSLLVAGPLGSSGFHVEVQQRTANPYYIQGGYERVPNTGTPGWLQQPYIWPSNVAPLNPSPHPTSDGSFIIDRHSGSLSGLLSGYPSITTLQEADARFDYLRNSDVFARASIPSFSGVTVDRNGNVRVNMSSAIGSQNSINYPSPEHRLVINVPPSVGSFHAPRHGSTTPPNSVPVPGVPSGFAVTGGLGTVISNFPASASDEIGVLEITIQSLVGVAAGGASGGVPGAWPVVIDFSNNNFEDYANAGFSSRNDYMVWYINQQLNAPSRRPAPPAFAHNTLYNINYPVARAHIPETGPHAGRLVITASERIFTVSVTERDSDHPMFVAPFAYPTRTGPTEMTISGESLRTGTNSANASLTSTMPGTFRWHKVPVDYQGTIDADWLLTYGTHSTTSGVNYPVPLPPITIGEYRLYAILTGEHLGNSFTSHMLTLDIRPFPDLWSIFSDRYLTTDAETHERQIWLANPEERDRGLPLWFQLGANTGQGILVGINGMTTKDLGYPHDLWNLIDVENPSGIPISEQIDTIDNALTYVTRERSFLGAVQNRLEFSQLNLDVASENLNTANSRVRDADMALEMMRLTQANVLQQAAVTLLAQANQAPQAVLQLLG